VREGLGSSGLKTLQQAERLSRPATTLIVTATITAPNRYESNACLAIESFVVTRPKQVWGFFEVTRLSGDSR
jgi:hypothetical protein